MGWLKTICYYAIAFFGGAIAWAATYYLHARMTGAISAESTSDPYYAIVSTVPVMFNVLPQLLAAWLLRRLARRLAWTKMWAWLLAGCVISFVCVFGFGQLGIAVERAHFSLDFQGPKTILLFILLGPIVATTKPIFLPLLAGGIVSLMLWPLRLKSAEAKN